MKAAILAFAMLLGLNVYAGPYEDAYFYHGDYIDGMSIFSKELTSCETALDEVKNLVDEPSLSKMAGDGHILYFLIQVPLNFESTCFDHGDTFSTLIRGLFISFDDIGRDFLRQWAKDHARIDFAGATVYNDKIEHLVTVFHMSAFGGSAEQLKYFTELSSYAELLQELLGFQDAFSKLGKKKALETFIAPRLKNPDLIQSFLDRSEEIEGVMLRYQSYFYIDGYWYPGTQSGDTGLVFCDKGADTCSVPFRKLRSPATKLNRGAFSLHLL